MDDRRRTELAAFLRARRTQLERAALALPRGARQGTHGLRREEVAALSGVSLTWYTWLEQGRDINPSRQVLDAIAHTLRATPAEHIYLLALAGFTADPADAGPPAEAALHLQRLLDALGGSPAFALGPDWSFVAWNDAYRALYPNVAQRLAKNRNLLWAVFTDPFVRELLPDWHTTSRRFLAEFRGEAASRLADPDFVRLIERLQARSPEFRDGWRRHDIEGFVSRRRSFRAAVGPLEFDQHRLVPSDRRDVAVVVYTAAAGPTDRRMARLRRLTPPLVP